MSGGRKRKDSPTQQGLRMSWLIQELVQEHGSQAEVARLTGLDSQYVHAFFNIETSGVKGVSSDILQLLHDKVGIDPIMFFEAWKPGEKRSYRLYSLAERRNARKTEGVDADLQGLRREMEVRERRHVAEMDALRTLMRDQAEKTRIQMRELTKLVLDKSTDTPPELPSVAGRPAVAEQPTKLRRAVHKPRDSR